MPRVETVKKARKSPGNCGTCYKKIEAGESYFKWAFRFGGKHQNCAIHYPRPSQLTQSKMSEAYSAIEDAEDLVSEWGTRERDTCTTCEGTGGVVTAKDAQKTLSEKVSVEIDIIPRMCKDCDGTGQAPQPWYFRKAPDHAFVPPENKDDECQFVLDDCMSHRCLKPLSAHEDDVNLPDLDDLKGYIDDCVSQLNDVAQEYRDAAEAMPAGADENNEKAENIEDLVNTLESCDFTEFEDWFGFEEGHDVEEAIEEWIGAMQSVASDALSSANF